ncbi:MAG: helix-turn-helix transcriptional regulator [Oscillospiraceae bacterium]|nr:helix-turn-helix transcriptional regulator [Oscillospiraceae bacterium]
MNPAEFGQFISEERAAKGLTQKELAERLGVTDKAISKWERGVCLPDVAKFDDIAAALDLTDLEVLRARRLPPEGAAEPAPRFITWRQAGRLLLSWLILTVALYAADLLNMLDLVTIYPLSIVLWYPLTAVLAVRQGLRDAEGVTSVDWRGVMGCWLTVVVSAFLVILMLEEGAQLLYWFMDIPDRLLGADLWEEQDYFFRGGFRWDLRWQLFRFLDMRFFNQDALLTIAEAFGVYALAKRLRIRGNQKKSQ